MSIVVAGGGPPSIFDQLPIGRDPATLFPPPAGVGQNPPADPTPGITGGPGGGYSTILRPPPAPASTTTAKDDVL